MEGVIGRVYAFYLQFPPPFLSLPYSLTFLCSPFLSSLMNKDGRHALAPGFFIYLVCADVSERLSTLTQNRFIIM